MGRTRNGAELQITRLEEASNFGSRIMLLVNFLKKLFCLSLHLSQQLFMWSTSNFADVLLETRVSRVLNVKLFSGVVQCTLIPVSQTLPCLVLLESQRYAHCVLWLAVPWQSSCNQTGCQEVTSCFKNWQRDRNFSACSRPCFKLHLGN